MSCDIEITKQTVEEIKHAKAMNTSVQTKNIGRITQIIGPVLDVAFPPGKMPNIYNALVVQGKNEAGDEIALTCEVQQLLVTIVFELSQ